MTASLLLAPGAREDRIAASGGMWRILQGAVPPPDDHKVPVLLLHGGGFDAAAISWYRLIAPLSAERRVIAPDLPGCGGTTGVPLLGRPDLVASQVVAVLDALGVERGVVCGVSMGGDLALELALGHPERVAGLVCIAPGGLVERVGPPITQFGTWLATRASDRGMALIARWSRPIIPRMLRGMVHDPATLPAEVVTAFLAEARRPDGGVAYGVYNRATVGPGRMRRDKSDAVAAIRAPALFFHGLHDAMVPIEGSRRAAASMPRARLVEVDQCGHWAQLEQHDVFLAHLRSFLAAVDPA